MCKSLVTSNIINFSGASKPRYCIFSRSSKKTDLFFLG
jgi:hypothetical protein